MKIPAKHSNNYHLTSNYPTTTDARQTLEEDSNDHSDWIVITSFYQALHCIDAYLLTKKRKPLNHEQRKSCIEQIRALDPIAEDYWRLKEASEFARYKKNTYRNNPTKVQELLNLSCSIIEHIKFLMKII